MGGPESQGTFVVAVGDRPQGGFGNGNDGRQNHDSQQNRRRKDAETAPAKVLPHKGDDDHQAKEAVDHRGNAGQEFHGGFQHPVELFGAEPSQEYGRQEPHRDTDG